MDLHLERRLRLHTESEYDSLYTWAINEIDAQRRKVGADQIPWGWTLYFTATSCVLGECIDIESNIKPLKTDEATPALPEIEHEQIIRVRLRPGSPQDDGNYLRETSFSMFGTDRVIKDFRLDIHAIADPAEQESCSAWGCVSYTSEIDFIEEITDDCLVFYLFVKPDTFAQYAAKIDQGAVDEMILSVGRVAGFYSEWSPMISTSNVKVLTRDSDHKVILPKGCQIEPPRLGQVGAAKLYINRVLEFGKRAAETEDAAEQTDFGTRRISPQVRTSFELDPQILHALKSLKLAAWFVACLLTLMFIVTFLKA